MNKLLSTLTLRGNSSPVAAAKSIIQSKKRSMRLSIFMIPLLICYVKIQIIKQIFRENTYL